MITIYEAVKEDSILHEKQKQYIITVPEETTNEELLKALFPRLETRYYGTDFISFSFDGIIGNTISKNWWYSQCMLESTYDWWNVPYKGGEK